MKQQLVLTVRRVDNGFTVTAQQPGVASSTVQKIASTEEEAIKIGTEILTNALTKPPQGT